MGVHRTTLVGAIQAGQCDGEKRGDRWYTSSAVAAKWYSSHYRHSGALYSDTVGRRWDDDKLLARLDRGDSIDAIAKAFGRTEKALRVKIAHLRAAGKAPTAAEIKTIRRKKEKIAEAKAILGEESPQDWHKQRRQDERDGRVRLHLHPEVKAALGRAARQAGLTLALFVTRAGLAAAADPEILKKGLQESEKLGKE